MNSLFKTGTSVSGYVHLVIIYLVWGSTYLAIRIGVQDGGGFPPLIMASSRGLVGSFILLILIKSIWNQKLKVGKEHLPLLAITGLLLFMFGTGGVSVAETIVDSGFAALIIGSTPLIVAIIETVIDRQYPSTLFVISLSMGFAGIAVLNGPAIIHQDIGQIKGVIILIIASCSWAIATVIQKRKLTGSSPVLNSAYQQCIGGCGLMAASLSLGEPLPAPTTPAWIAWGYLVIFGSIIAFTSYVYAIRALPTKIVMTYAYVNPIIAVFLGWLILDEKITSWTLSGAVLIILGVIGVFRDQNKYLNEH